jgi:hypothetical protein
MGKRPKVAFVQVALYHDPETDSYSVECMEWRRGERARLSGFIDEGPFGFVEAEQQALAHYLDDATKVLLGDVVGLDRARMF